MGRPLYCNLRMRRQKRKKNLDELKILISNIVGVDAGIMVELVSPEQSRNSLDLSDLIDKINFDVQFKK
jgi:hypothetical protein